MGAAGEVINSYDSLGSHDTPCATPQVVIIDIVCGFSTSLYCKADPHKGCKGTCFEGSVRVLAFVNGGPLPDKMRGETTDGFIHILQASWS